jgi:multimeric flavodoxin WrbA
MKAYILSDGEFVTEKLRRLECLVKRCLGERGFEITEKRLAPEELAYCIGCFSCWIKKPGECLIKDTMAEINRGTMTCDVVVYLCPVVFGQFSANIKNAIDRWVPNVLPFFIIRPDGSTIHQARYKTNPRFVMIGYGENLSEKDVQLFIDITKKHHLNREVLIYNNNDEETASELLTIELERAGDRL